MTEDCNLKNIDDKLVSIKDIDATSLNNGDSNSLNEPVNTAGKEVSSDPTDPKSKVVTCLNEISRFPENQESFIAIENNEKADTSEKNEIASDNIRTFDIENIGDLLSTLDTSMPSNTENLMSPAITGVPATSTTNADLDSKDSIESNNIEKEVTESTSVSVVGNLETVLKDSQPILCDSQSKLGATQSESAGPELGINMGKTVESDDVIFIENVPKTNIDPYLNMSEDEILQKKLDDFLNWSKNMLIEMSEKVKICYRGTSHRYGMIATQEIKKGEEIFSVPRQVLLNPDSTSIFEQMIEYEEWLEGTGKSLEDSSGWVPLLITLMYEYNSESSPWKPYLQLIPETKDFGHPLFWSDKELDSELQGLSLQEDTKQDINNLEDEYKRYVVPFVYRNKHICKSLERFSLDLYKRMVAFIMAYSFTEFADTSPSMIPMADILNHHSNNNACLLFGQNKLKMICSQKINAGEEIFNTFGKLGNMSLLQMYGYVETPFNQYDSVIVSVSFFIEELESSNTVPSSCLHAMVAYLGKTSIAMPDDFFVFDKNGMRSGPDFVNMLKIFHMSVLEFECMLRTRAGNRHDSYYHKLLRKLQLARKTDLSSGVAVIDITEDEEEEGEESAGQEDVTSAVSGVDKRKFIECQEIVDTDEDNAAVSPAKKSCFYEDTSFPLQCGQQPLIHPIQRSNSHVGSTALSAILIDDESDDEIENVATEKNFNIDKKFAGGCAKEGEYPSCMLNKEKHTLEEVLSETLQSVSSPSKNIKKDDSVSVNIPLVGQISASTVAKVDDVLDVTKGNDLNDNTYSSEQCTLKNTENKLSDSLETTINNISSDTETVSISMDNSDIPDRQSPFKAADNDDPTSENDNTNILIGISNGTDGPLNKDALEKETIKTNDESSVTNTISSNDNPVSSSVDTDPSQIQDSVNITSPKIPVSITTKPDIEIPDTPKPVVLSEEVEMDEDDDDIEFLSEDIKCSVTYDTLKNELKPEWKHLTKRVLRNILKSFKQDSDDEAGDLPETSLRNHLNALQLRNGQRRIIDIFLAVL